MYFYTQYYQSASKRIELAMAKSMLFILVKHPDEINEIFDRISYGKGASIIRMMDKFLTSDSFKKVIFINDAKLLLIRGLNWQDKARGSKWNDIKLGRNDKIYHVLDKTYLPLR